MKRKTLGLSLCLVLVATAGCASPRRERATVRADSLKGRGAVFLVPLGDLPPSKLTELAAYYRGKYGLTVRALPPVPLDAAAFDDERQQFAAERLIELMKRGRPEQAADPDAILIGLTGGDIYIERYDWRFSFSYRQGGRFAVVSEARMRPGRGGDDRAPARLRKMVTKNIGVMHYGLRPNDDPRSVLYKNVLGLDELDRMGEDF